MKKIKSILQNNNVFRECISLPYSKNKSDRRAILEDTVSKLEILYDKYGIANVVGSLSSLWTFEEATIFLEKTKKKTETKKIRTIATSYHKGYGGGVERVNAELMRIWTQMGLRVVMYTEEHESSLDFPYPETVKRILIPKTNSIKDRLIMLERNCRKEHVDLFINHDWTNPGFLWEYMLMRVLGIKYVQYCHGHFAWNFNNRQGIRQAESFRLCDIVVAISKTNAKFYQMLGCNTFFSANPIPVDLLENKEKASPKGNHILMIGRLSHEKYTMEALEVFSLIHSALPNVILDVVGDGQDYGKMKHIVNGKGISGSVYFHGNVRANKISDFYKEASCVLFTSKMEGYPMTLLEAKAFGVPVVMYDLPYLSLVEDHKGIVSVPVGDIKHMANAVKSILKNQDYQKQLALEAYESFKILAKHDHKADWETILDLCSDLNTYRKTGSYYDPLQLPEDELYILGDLLDKVYQIGDDNCIKNTGKKIYRRLIDGIHSKLLFPF